MPALIELDHVSKRFAGIKALDDVSLAVEPGAIHCLAGENGSGKSTIIKVMSGVYRPDGGTIKVDGMPIAHMTPASSVAAGIQVIYQDLSLFGNLTVAENLAMNKVLKDGRRRIDWGETRRLARAALDRLKVDLPLDADVETLPTAGKQLVAIARALLAEARLLIMDEPTTALTRNEVERLLEVTRAIQKDGIAVLFVSHKMREMLEISERLTVMRNGRVGGGRPDRGLHRSLDHPPHDGPRSRVRYLCRPHGEQRAAAPVGQGAGRAGQRRGRRPHASARRHPRPLRPHRRRPHRIGPWRSSACGPTTPALSRSTGRPSP